MADASAIATQPTVSLDDRYTRTSGTVLITGVQALVRLLLDQRRLDRLAGLNTAGFVSGYRGSPLGTLDQTLWANQSHLTTHDIVFKPGLNEELAATAVWGSQQTNLFEGATVDGVFSLWYGKGPGVDRAGDAIKHANATGSSTLGGVVMVCGDDHGAKSSTFPHQSEQAMIAAMIPVLHPAGVQEVLDFGLHAFAMSRYSGCWVALKAVTENMDASATINVDAARLNIRIPDSFTLPKGGLNIRWPDPATDQEHRLVNSKLPAAKAFARANRLDRTIWKRDHARLAIITTGKAYLDTMQALHDLGIDRHRADELGIGVFKVGLVWPLDDGEIITFCEHAEIVLVIEEKRALIEEQLCRLLNAHRVTAPIVVGKKSIAGKPLLPEAGELNPALIGNVIAGFCDTCEISPATESAAGNNGVQFFDAQNPSANAPLAQRKPHFCSGCPHNTSTRVPEGSRAVAGIGCHYMATWMPRNTMTYTQMGGEGVTWIGQAPFTRTKHIFQNLGDGTYLHSGILGIRAALVAGSTITFKLLFNDAVAMTGGQPHEGNFSVAQLTHQLYAEGVRLIAVVSEDPQRHHGVSSFAAGVTLHAREELDTVQALFREAPGVSVIIYDQTCAAEKRRRRKRGEMENPTQSAFINHRVCEGCGDCSTQSNCLSVVPRETVFGRKREIDQDACNKDMSCLKGFCPSFVTVKGTASNRTAKALALPALPAMPEPARLAHRDAFNMIISGVGGAGIVTTASIIAMAAHMDGLNCKTLDITGLAQKFGAVLSHLRIAGHEQELFTPRVPAHQADLLMGCDLIVSHSEDCLHYTDKQRTQAVINTHVAATADFTSDRDTSYDVDGMRERIRASTRARTSHCFDITELCKQLFGTSINSNLFILGYTLQKGWLPVSLASVHKAIELNHVDVAANLVALDWGRACAHAPEQVHLIVERHDERTAPARMSSEQRMRHFSRELRAYQDCHYAKRYRRFIKAMRRAELLARPGSTVLTDAVIDNYYKLLAYKDEYEVARLHSNRKFLQEIREQFGDDAEITFNLAPPVFSGIDPNTGRPKKRQFGSWMLPVFRTLRRLRFLRGRHFDIFGYSKERRAERRLIADYERLMQMVIMQLCERNFDTALTLLTLPQMVRGYGPVKMQAIADYEDKRKTLLARLQGSGASIIATSMTAMP
jgi:indolepyruvate ferredoxin oxidoreductase